MSDQRIRSRDQDSDAALQPVFGAAAGSSEAHLGAKEKSFQKAAACGVQCVSWSTTTLRWPRACKMALRLAAAWVVSGRRSHLAFQETIPGLRLPVSLHKAATRSSVVRPWKRRPQVASLGRGEACKRSHRAPGLRG